MTPAEKFQAEQAQNEIDHHTPTAGAMCSHILANLVIHSTKLKQGILSAKGAGSRFIKTTFSEMYARENQLFDELAEVLLDEGEAIPTTTAEFLAYTMLEEAGALKYESSQNILIAAVEDLNTQKLFLTRGIALAEKEEKYPLQAYLIRLLSWNQRQARVLQDELGFEVTEEE